MQMPWRTEIIEGLLGADLVGFHLLGGAQNFLFLSRRLVGANTSRGDRRRAVTIRRGAAGIPHRSSGRLSDLHRLRRARPDSARNRDIRRHAREIRADLGNPRKILLGVDRLDYTKGIDVRLKAFSELLAEGRVKRDDTVLVQLATPSRERVESYQILRNDIEREVGHINGEYGEVGHPMVHYIHRAVPRDELIAFFVASDVMLVTPLRDGMNLVAKEYVACRSDLGGALVLSEFTGAAAELRQAYLVNPHDLEGVKDAIEAALQPAGRRGRRRMRSLRRQVLAHDVDRWARSFLDALAEAHPPDAIAQRPMLRRRTRGHCEIRRALAAGAGVFSAVAIGIALESGNPARASDHRPTAPTPTTRRASRGYLDNLGTVRSAVRNPKHERLFRPDRFRDAMCAEHREFDARADQRCRQAAELQRPGPDVQHAMEFQGGQGGRCLMSGWWHRCRSTETFAFSDETMSGTHTTMHGAVCGMEPAMKKTPFSGRWPGRRPARSSVIPCSATTLRSATEQIDGGLDRRDVLDQPLAVDLLIVDPQPAAVVDRAASTCRSRCGSCTPSPTPNSACADKHPHANDIGLD